MHPALAAITEDCISATNTCQTDTTGVLSRFLHHIQINARLHYLCLSHVKLVQICLIIFQKRFPDDVSSQHRPCVASTLCTRSNMATTNTKKLTTKTILHYKWHMTMISRFLVVLRLARCEIGVQLSVRPFVRPSTICVEFRKFTSSLGINFIFLQQW